MEGSIILNTRLPLRSPFVSETALRTFVESNQVAVGELLIVKTETLYYIFKVTSVTPKTTMVIQNGTSTQTTIYNTVLESVIQTTIKNNPNYFRYIGSFDSYADLQSTAIQSILKTKDIFYLIDDHNGERVTTAVMVDENGNYHEIKMDLEPEDLDDTSVSLSWVEYKTQTTKRIKPIIALRPYTRNGGFALDATSYYNSYNEAESYVRTSGAAYPGQIISVDDETKKKVTIYKVVYAETGSIYRYKLNEIGSGTSASDGSTRYRGIVDDYTGLSVLLTKHLDPNDTYVLSANDLVYVKTPQGSVPYIYTGIAEEGKAWEKVSIGITLATEEDDGFISSEVYKTWVSDQEGIFYSAGTGEVEDNKFIPLQVTGSTDSREMMTSDMVKKTILDMINTDSIGTIDVTFSRDITNFINGEYVNDLTAAIAYTPNGSGALNKCTISSSYSGNATLYTLNFAYDSNKKAYVAQYNIPAFIANTANNNILEFVVKYDYNDITMQQAGEIIKKYSMKVYKQMSLEYGKITGALDTSAGSNIVYILKPINNKELSLIKIEEGESYILETPSNKNISYVTFYTPYPIKEAEFVERQDREFLDVLEYTSYSEDTRFSHKYTMRGYPSYPINSKMTFKLTF